MDAIRGISETSVSGVPEKIYDRTPEREKHKQDIPTPAGGEDATAQAAAEFARKIEEIAACICDTVMPTSDSTAAERNKLASQLAQLAAGLMEHGADIAGFLTTVEKAATEGSGAQFIAVSAQALSTAGPSAADTLSAAVETLIRNNEDLAGFLDFASRITEVDPHSFVTHVEVTENLVDGGASFGDYLSLTANLYQAYISGVGAEPEAFSFGKVAADQYSELSDPFPAQQLPDNFLTVYREYLARLAHGEGLFTQSILDRLDQSLLPQIITDPGSESSEI